MSCTEEKHITRNHINGVACNALFICEVKSETERLDLRRDSMGTWRETKRFTKQPYKGTSRSKSKADSYVWRIRYQCTSCPSLSKIEIYRRKCNSDGSVGGIISPMVIQYVFAGSPQQVEAKPHGNSKGSLPFHPSRKSLLERISSESSKKTTRPLSLYNKVINSYCKQ